MDLLLLSHTVFNFDNFIEIQNQNKDLFDEVKIEYSEIENSFKILILLKQKLFSKQKKIKIEFTSKRNPSNTTNVSKPPDYPSQKITALYSHVLEELPNNVEFSDGSNIKEIALKKLLSCNTIINIEAEKFTDDIFKIVQQFANKYETIFYDSEENNLFKDEGFYDKNFNLIIDIKGNTELENYKVKIDPIYNKIENISTNPEIRKYNSIIFLKNKGIEIPEILPNIEKEENVVIRQKNEITHRALILTLINLVANNVINVERCLGLIRRQGLNDYLTEKEKKFLETLDSNKLIEYTWQIERIYVLLWSLNKIDFLKFPYQQIQVGRDIPLKNYPINLTMLPKISKSLIGQFLFKTYKLKTKSEILDEVDIYYRMMWAARNYHPIKTGLNYKIIEERFATLNWLVNYENSEWDNISIDS